MGEGRVGRKGCMGRDEKEGGKKGKEIGETDRRKKIDREGLREKGGRNNYYAYQMTQFNTVDTVARQRKPEPEDRLDCT